MKYTVRRITAQQIDQAVDLFLPFFAEGAYKDLTLDMDRAFETFSHILQNEGYFALVAYDEDDNPVGGHIFGVESQFTVEPVAMCVLFYIQPEHRRGGCAKTLVDVSNALCDNLGVGIFYTSSTGGFDDDGVNERAFTMLMKRNGFEHVGSFLRRVNPNVKS